MSKESRAKRSGWNWAPVPAAVFMSENLTHADVRVYAYLLWRSGEDDKSWPKVETIAKDIHMSEPAVKRSFRNLIEDNWIRRSRRVGHSSLTYIFEHQDDCIAYDTDPSVVSRAIRRGIADDTVNVSPDIRLNKSQLNKSQNKNIKEEEEAPAQSLTVGQSQFLKLWNAKRFSQRIQADHILEMERSYGTEKMLEAARWAATEGMTMGHAINSMKTALPKWDKPKVSKNGNNPRPPAPAREDVHDVIARLKKEYQAKEAANGEPD